MPSVPSGSSSQTTTAKQEGGGGNSRFELGSTQYVPSILPFLFFFFCFVSLSHRFVLLRIYISPSNEWQDQVTAMLRAKVKVKAASNNGNKHGDNKDGKVLGRANSRAMRMQSRTRSASGSSVKGGMYHLVSLPHTSTCPHAQTSTSCYGGNFSLPRRFFFPLSPLFTCGYGEKEENLIKSRCGSII